MWQQVINYLMLVLIFGSQDVLGKIHQNELESNDNLRPEKRSNTLKKNEYVPLNSITLNLLYNKNKPKHALNSNKRNRWIKPRKNIKHKLKSNVDYTVANINKSTKSPSNLVDRVTTKISTTSKVIMQFSITSLKISIYLIY